MEKNRDSRIATASAVNGLSGKRRTITSLKDSAEEDREMELQETVRLRDRELLQKKDRDRDFAKRRRIERYMQQQKSGDEIYRDDDCTGASDEEYCEEEEEARIQSFNRTNQPSPQSSSFSNSRRSLRTHRSSPVLRFSVDETIGVPVPRRARSASTKRLHEYVNTSSGRLGEDLNRRVFSPSPVTANKICTGGVYPGSLAPSTKKKKKKSAVLRTRGLNSTQDSRPSSVIQEDIEIEVVEALFDLMRQSQSLSQISKNTADEEFMKRSKNEQDEPDAFSVRYGKSIKVEAEAIMNDSIEELKKEKYPKKASGDGFLNDEKVRSQNSKESKQPTCIKVNELESQNPTGTKVPSSQQSNSSFVVKSSWDYAAVVVETKKEAKLDIDLMSPPPLPSTPEKDVLAHTASVSKFMAQDVQKKTETISIANRPQEQKIAAISNNLLPNVDLGNFYHNTSSVRDNGKPPHQQWGQKEQKNQLQTSLLPFQISLNGWPGVLPKTGFIPPLPTVLPVDGNGRFPTAIQPPKFKFTQPRRKRCTTHQYIARNIHYHQQLVTKSLGSGSTGAAATCGIMPLNLNPSPPTFQNPFLGDFQGGNNMATISNGHGKDKSSEVPAVTKAIKNKEIKLQKGALQAPSNNFLHAPTFTFPFGHHQTTVMAPAKLSGPPQTASASTNTSLPTNSPAGPLVSLPLPVQAAAVRFTNPNFPPNEVAPYMTMLQNNGLQFPISASIATSQMKGGTQSPHMPPVNPSFYSSSMFHASETQKQSAPSPVRNQNFPTLASAHSQQAEKREHPLSELYSKSDADFGRKCSASLTDASVPHFITPNTGRSSSFPVQAMNFGTIPQGSIGSNLSSKDMLELLPRAFAVSSGSNASASPINFASMAQNSALFQMLPELTWNGYQMSNQKSFQTSEGKSATTSRQIDGLKGSITKSQKHGGKSSNFCKSGVADIPSIPMMGSSMVDGLARGLNFIPSASTGNQQPYLSSPVSHASGVPGILQSLHQHQHQHQPIQLQKHYTMPMQQTGTASSNSGSFLPGYFPSNHPSLSQFSVQHDNSSPNCQSLPRTIAPKGSSQSSNSVVANNPQAKSSQGGETHVSLGSGSVSAASFQEHIIAITPIGLPFDSPVSKNTSGSRRSPTSDDADSTIPASSSQQTSSSNGPNQKSSPACRRNVPSILSTCPGQLSELKY